MPVLPDTEPSNAGQQQEPGLWENSYGGSAKCKGWGQYLTRLYNQGLCFAIWNPEQLQCKGFTGGCP